MFLLVFAGCSREKPGVAVRSTASDVLEVTTVLSTIADDEKPLQPIPGHGVEPVSQNRPAPFQVIFSESGRGVAYVAEKGGKVYVVHNGRAGKPFESVGDAVLSSDGRRIAYAARAANKWRMVIYGKEGRPYDVLLTPIFSPDGQHVAYHV